MKEQHVENNTVADNVMRPRPPEWDGRSKATFEIFGREQLFTMEPPAWLIEGLYVQDGLCQVFGDPASFKSFLALAVACSVATGKPFLGTIEPGKVGDVVYISAEGGRGIG